MKKSFILYTDLYTSIKDLKLDEKGKMLDAIFNYAINKKEIKLTPILEMAFSFIKNQLDRDNEKWCEIREKRKQAGSKGGKMRVANQANATFAKQIKQDQANQAVNVNVNANVNVISNREKFKNYLKEIKNDPEFSDKNISLELKKFMDYLLANGKKYKDYSAAFRNWLRRSGDFTFKKQEVKGENERMLEKLNAT